ncbi:sirQ protein [Colletotrichum tofieldiae]|nr:sirQ protein [Colletotrichum tofieldiae]
MADNAMPTKFSEIWPSLANWFGLKGVGPTGEENDPKPGEYIDKNKHIFEEKDLGRAMVAGVGGGSSQLDSVGYWLSFDRQLSLERLRSLGFMEEMNPVEGWLEAFEKFREAGIIF